MLGAVLFLFVVMMLNINEVLVKEGFKVFSSWVTPDVSVFKLIQRSRVFGNNNSGISISNLLIKVMKY